MWVVKNNHKLTTKKAFLFIVGKNKVKLSWKEWLFPIFVIAVPMLIMVSAMQSNTVT